MATSVVKCLYCGASFSRDIEPYVKIKNRYAHLDCSNKHEAEAQELRKLTDFIQSLYKGQEPDWKVIGTQIQRYKKEGMTYYGMYHTLEYFFCIKKNDITKSAGVGIIPYAYKKAQAYFANVSNSYTQAARVEQQNKLNVAQTENVIIVENTKPKKKLIELEY